MQRGNLIIYDEVGTIISQTGEAQGCILPHEYPVGVSYIELLYGSYRAQLSTSRIVRIDPITKIPEFETYEDGTQPLPLITLEEKFELMQQALDDILLGGI